MSDWSSGKLIDQRVKTSDAARYTVSTFQAEDGSITIEAADHNRYRILGCPPQVMLLAVDAAPRPNDLTDGVTLRFVQMRVEDDMRPTPVVAVEWVSGALERHPAVQLGGYYRLDDVGSGKTITPRPTPDFLLVALREDGMWSEPVLDVIGGSQGVYVFDQARTVTGEDGQAYEMHFLYNVPDNPVESVVVPGYDDPMEFVRDSAEVPVAYESAAVINALPASQFTPAAPCEESFLSIYRYTGERHAGMVHERLTRDLVAYHVVHRDFTGAPRPEGPRP